MTNVQGDDDGAGFGVEGTSTRPQGTGVYGYSPDATLSTSDSRGSN